MVSETREEDRAIRVLMLECMQIAIRHGLIEQAKDIGLSARKMAEKIKTHDYTQADRALKKLQSIM